MLNLVQDPFRRRTLTSSKWILKRVQDDGRAAQSPAPGSPVKYLSYLPSSPLCSSASAGLSFLRVMLGHSAEKLVLSSSHFSSPLSVSGRMASAGHSGSQTPQSMHSLGLMTSITSPS